MTRPQPDRKLLESLAVCDEALLAKPTSARLHLHRGSLLIQLKRWVDAEAALRTSVALDPRPAKAWETLAMALEGQDRPLAAAGAPGSLAGDADAAASPALMAQFRLAFDALAEGQAETAQGLLEGVLHDRPHWPEAWLALRRAVMLQGGDDEAVIAQWRTAAPANQAIIRMATARPLSPRGLLFDPAAPLRLRPKIEALRRVETREGLAAGDDVYRQLEPGGAPVRHEPILSVEPDGSDARVIETHTSESFVAAFADAALVGRGLVVSRRNEVVAETLLQATTLGDPLWKYHVVAEDGGLRPDRQAYADGDLPVRFFDEPAFLMAGPTDTGFGDWIWRFHPRLTLLRDAGLEVPLVVGRDTPERFLDLLRISGFDRSRLLFHDPDTVSVFRRLYVPSWPTPDRISPMTDWYDAFTPIARKAHELALSAGSERPRLYLARTRIRGRELVNEEQVCALFASRGFQIIHPQELPLPELLRLFGRPAIVAGPYGSALRNMAFSFEKPLGLFLMPPYDEAFLPGTALWPAELGVRFARVFGGAVGDRLAGPTRPRAQWREPWTVDLEKVERALDMVLAAAEAR